MTMTKDAGTTRLIGIDIPYHIVVVDDERTICDLLRRGLNEDNFLVTGVTNAVEAVATVTSIRPCLVILDIHMPGKSGLEILKELKQIAPEIPVVLITGQADAADRDIARKLGACDLLTKPVNWNYLRNIAHLSSFLKVR
jgi:DNA-binding response OmpR family regulator